MEKASVHARLGVPEIWRWRDGRLVALVRSAAGDYVEQPASNALHGFPLADLAEALAAYPQVPAARSVAALRQRIAWPASIGSSVIGS